MGVALPAQALPAFCGAHTPEAETALSQHLLSCGFDRARAAYAGTPVEQARCLLRFVQPGGTLADAKRLPHALERLVGKRVDLSPAAFAAYLTSIGVAADDIGGPLDGPLAHTEAGMPAAYFVIHDTSTPNYGLSPIPAEIDSPTWAYADLRPWQGPNAVAHLFIARDGHSLTGHDYAVPWRATKAESCVLQAAGRGLFLHHELVEPRRSDPAKPPGNDALAPAPPSQAITDAQLDRLALAYVAASVRGGHWLVPGFHATIDEGLADAHDDPQGFRLADWARAIERVRAAVSASRSKHG